MPEVPNLETLSNSGLEGVQSLLCVEHDAGRISGKAPLEEGPAGDTGPNTEILKGNRPLSKFGKRQLYQVSSIYLR